MTLLPRAYRGQVRLSLPPPRACLPRLVDQPSRGQVAGYGPPDKRNDVGARSGLLASDPRERLFELADERLE